MALASLIRYPAAERNKAPILEVLRKIFSNEPIISNVLEIGSATGQHLAHFAAALPTIQFQPSDVNSQLFDNINLFRDQLKLTNLRPPFVLDLTWPPEKWPLAAASTDALYCANVLHISPWECTLGLFSGASRILRSGGLLLIYGPFATDGVLSPESNIEFDESLRTRNATWGIRDTVDLKRLAGPLDLVYMQSFSMPANNQVLLFKRK